MSIGKNLYLSVAVSALFFTTSNINAAELSSSDTFSLPPIQTEKSNSYQIARAVFLPETADDLGMSGRHFKDGYYSPDINCTDYDLTSCPKKWNCSECLRNGVQTVYKKDSCKNPYIKQDDDCVCPPTVDVGTNENCTKKCDDNCIEKGCSPLGDITTCSNGVNNSCSDGCGGTRKCCNDCVDTYTGSLPSHAHYIKSDCNDNGGKQQIKTGWECDSGYHQKNNACEQDCAINDCADFPHKECPNGAAKCTPCTKTAQNCSTDGVRYKVDSCKEGYEPSGNTCVEKKVSPAIPEGYSTTPCSSSNTVETDKMQDETGRWLYQCKDCMAYAKHLGKAVVYQDDEFHEDLLYKALASGAEEIYVSGLVWISNESAKACANFNRTCAQTITFKNLKDLHNICAYEQDGELDGSGQEFQVNWMNLHFEIPVYLEKLRTNNGNMMLQFDGPHGIESTIEEIYTNNDLQIAVNSGELNISSIAANGNVYFDCGSNAFINSYMATSWCCNNKDQFYCQQSCFRNGTGCF